MMSERFAVWAMKIRNCSLSVHFYAPVVREWGRWKA